MGCVGSSGQRDIDKHPNVFRVVNVNADGLELWSGNLEISLDQVTLYRKGKEPTKWPLQCLRRYGYENDLFCFEAGRRCLTGEGIYSFRCRRAADLFHLLQSYIHGNTLNHNNNLNTANAEELPSPGADEVDRQTTTGSNYIVIHGGGGATSPTGTIDSVAGPQEGQNNYLEPLSSSEARFSALQNRQSSGSIDLASAPTPDSPHSISSPVEGAPGNAYHELALARSGASPTLENNSKKGNANLIKLRSLLSSDDVQSPTIRDSSESLDDTTTNTTPTYMNITPGQDQITGNSRFSQRNSIFSSFPERCYENLDPIIVSNGLKARFSKPDIFAKVDLPQLAHSDGSKSSEPCTPTSIPNRTMHYIVLDLDAQSNSTATNSAPSTATPTQLQPPESPTKKTTATLGYVTIDFNKTVALSNSTNPSMGVDSEGSRKTRHSSSVEL